MRLLYVRNRVLDFQSSRDYFLLDDSSTGRLEDWSGNSRSLLMPDCRGLRDPGKPLARPAVSPFDAFPGAPPSQNPLSLMFSRGFPAMSSPHCCERSFNAKWHLVGN